MCWEAMFSFETGCKTERLNDWPRGRLRTRDLRYATARLTPYRKRVVGRFEVADLDLDLVSALLVHLAELELLRICFAEELRLPTGGRAIVVVPQLLPQVRGGDKMTEDAPRMVTTSTG